MNLLLYICDEARWDFVENIFFNLVANLFLSVLCVFHIPKEINVSIDVSSFSIHSSFRNTDCRDCTVDGKNFPKFISRDMVNNTISEEE